MVLTLTDYVMLQQQDKQSHKVHDYNADTLLVEMKLEDYPCFSISLKVDNELDKPAILSFRYPPAKYFQKNNISIRNQCISRLLLTSDLPTTGTLFQHDKYYTSTTSSAFKSIES
jgi:hypothetical protein